MNYAKKSLIYPRKLIQLRNEKEGSHMPLIKRYPNRKLYDTENNKYVNLLAITRMIEDGLKVQVIDHVTGEDITSLTFAQIIMEREKKEREFIPQSILAQLIKMGGESINVIRDILTSSIDLIQQVDREITTRLEELIQRGEIAEEEGKKLKDKLIVKTNLMQYSDKDILDALIRHGIPLQNDYQEIINQVDELSVRLEDYQ